jgi:mono/diheme cytochrome c family protein
VHERSNRIEATGARPGRPRRSRRPGWKRLLLWTVGALVVVFALIQAVPYGRAHENPPVTAEPVWDRTTTRTLFMDACGDCHSNQTDWPWYSNIAPVSWLVQRDVDDGRANLNLSRLGSTELELDEIAEVIREGSMPPWQYSLLHSKARLSDEEKQQLITGLATSLGATATPVGSERGEDE